MSYSKKLKFGVIINNDNIKAWENDCIEYLLSDGIAELALIITRTPSFKENSRRSGLCSFFTKITGKFINFKGCNSIALRPIYSLVESIDTITYDECLQNQATVESKNLDFILLLHPDNIDERIASIPMHKTWCFAYNIMRSPTKNLPGFWEIYHKENTSTTCLVQISKSRNQGIILQQSELKTINYSYPANADAIASESSQLLLSFCKHLVHSPQRLNTNEEVTWGNNDTDHLDLLSAFKMCWRLFINKYSSLYNITEDEWNIGIIKEPLEKVYQKIENSDSLEIDWLNITKQKVDYIADPFGIQINDDYYLFYEYFEFTDKGSLGCLHFNIDNGKTIIRNYQNILKTEYHLSYPYPIQYEGKNYLLPECYQSEELSIYEFVEFPYKLKKYKTLIKGLPILDASIIQHDGYWWIFGTLINNASSKLHIWYSDDLFGHYKEHPLNPVVTNVKTARPGGAPFKIGDSIFRPGQNSSSTYGGQLSISKIITLSTDDYQEEHVNTIHGIAPFDRGVHTLSACGDITLIDGKKLFIKSHKEALTRTWNYTKDSYIKRLFKFK